jgi:hypothetical protein
LISIGVIAVVCEELERIQETNMTSSRLCSKFCEGVCEGRVPSEKGRQSGSAVQNGLVLMINSDATIKMSLRMWENRSKSRSECEETDRTIKMSLSNGVDELE